MINAGETVEKRELALLVRLQIEITTVENSMETYFKKLGIKYHITQQLCYWAYTLRKP